MSIVLYKQHTLKGRGDWTAGEGIDVNCIELVLSIEFDSISNNWLLFAIKINVLFSVCE